MDIGKLGGKLTQGIKKYRYPLLVLLVGILLMILPGQKKEKTSVQEPVQQTQAPQTDMVQELENILGQIKGVGKVQVLLTQSAGERYEFQQDRNQSDTGEAGDTVIITDADRNQSPVLVQTMGPEYLGAIIVCQGASTPEVKLAVVEAVSKATGLSTDRISVLKMK